MQHYVPKSICPSCPCVPAICIYAHVHVHKPPMTCHNISPPLPMPYIPFPFGFCAPYPSFAFVIPTFTHCPPPLLFSCHMSVLGEFLACGPFFYKFVLCCRQGWRGTTMYTDQIHMNQPCGNLSRGLPLGTMDVS